MIVADHLIPLADDNLKSQFVKGSVADIAYFCSGDEPFESFKTGSIVLMFVDSLANSAYATKIVASLGRMFSAWEGLNVVVLGSLITSENQGYNCSSFVEIVEKAYKCGLYPIVIASDQSYAAQLCEVRRKITPLHLGFVTPSMSSMLPNGTVSVVDTINELAIGKSDSIAILASQAYYADSSLVAKFQNTYLQQARLGAIRESMRLAEPLLRDLNLLFVDVNAIRYSDFTSATSPTPNGLYAEEICQLMRYAGYSDNLTSLFICGIDPQKLAANEMDVMLVTQMLWHAFDGLAARRNELPGLTSFASKEFYIDLGEQEPLTLNFMQSQNTGRWWLYVPNSDGSGRWLACDAEDYERAKHHELPYRWICLFNIIG